jgi:hypothetical protein
MAEIKSTLDIIMERTKNLTITEGEKRAFLQKELKAKAKGWIQKYLDGIINSGQFKSNIEKEKNPEVLHEIIKMELLGFLQLQGGNEKIYTSLKDVLFIEPEPFRMIAESFQKKIEREKLQKLETIRNSLKERKICGSSIIPNINNDKTWDTEIRQLTIIFHKSLRSVD